jgi:hypothetical protein
MISDGTPALLRIGLTALALSHAAAGTVAAQTSADELTCSYSRRSVCSTEGCEPSEVGFSHLRVPALPALREAVDRASPIQIRRCDAGGCAAVEITDAGAGGFLTLSGQHGAYLIKIYAGPPIRELELVPGDFIEVVTSMLTTWVGYGRCEE